MQFFCSKCEKPVIFPEENETVDGYLITCPDCDGPIAFISYKEANAMEGKSLIYLSEDQQKYLCHILDKQLVKLHNAANQLMDMKEQLMEEHND